MKEKHIIVVEYPEGISPRYSADTELLNSGRIVSVDFDGNRLELLGLLQEAAQEVFDLAHGFSVDGVYFTELKENIDALNRLECALDNLNRV